MEIKDLYPKQKRLDEFVIKNCGLENVPQHVLTDQKIIAFKVELGEFANEFGSFKFWKQNHEIDLDKTREELIDCVHFLLSIANDRQYTFIEKTTKADYFNMTHNELLFHLFENKIASSGQWLFAMEMLVELGKRLGMDEIQFKWQYHRKYKKNLKRQIDKY